MPVSTLIALGECVQLMQDSLQQQQQQQQQQQERQQEQQPKTNKHNSVN